MNGSFPMGRALQRTALRPAWPVKTAYKIKGALQSFAVTEVAVHSANRELA
jgi:hypothetical protein